MTDDLAHANGDAPQLLHKLTTSALFTPLSGPYFSLLRKLLAYRGGQQGTLRNWAFDQDRSSSSRSASHLYPLEELDRWIAET